MEQRSEYIVKDIHDALSLNTVYVIYHINCCQCVD